MDDPVTVISMRALLAAALSAVLASFFMTAACRAVSGLDWRACIGGRSRCAGCGRVLRGRDLVPVFSYALLRGRCRFCAVPIGAAAFAAETASFLLGAACGIWLQGAAVLAGAVLSAALAALAACDWQSGFLPDILTLPLSFAGIGLSLAGAGPAPADALIGAAAGFAVLWLAAAAYRNLRGREGLGGGDARLLAAAGAWLGWQWLAPVLLLAAVATLVGALLWHILARRRLSGGTELPFGPGLCAAFWLCWMAASAVAGRAG